jgi:hypothetical protein
VGLDSSEPFFVELGSAYFHDEDLPCTGRFKHFWRVKLEMFSCIARYDL